MHENGEQRLSPSAELLVRKQVASILTRVLSLGALSIVGILSYAYIDIKDQAATEAGRIATNVLQTLQNKRIEHEVNSRIIEHQIEELARRARDAEEKIGGAETVAKLGGDLQRSVSELVTDQAFIQQVTSRASGLFGRCTLRTASAPSNSAAYGQGSLAKCDPGEVALGGACEAATSSCGSNGRLLLRGTQPVAFECIRSTSGGCSDTMTSHVICCK